MKPWRPSDRCTAWLGLALAGITGAPLAQEAADTSAISGRLTTRYRARFTGEESDHDLYETADLTLADPAGRWTGAVLVRAAFDIDGNEDPDSDFFGLLDTYEHRLEAQLFHAYLDWKSDSFSLLRFGRQPLYETPVTVILDGLRADLNPSGEQRVLFGAYAGVGEHLYESSDDGDLVLGTFGAAQPWSGGEVRADWMRLEDARLGVDHENDLFGLSLLQSARRADSTSRLDGRFTSLEGNGRDVRVSGTHVDASAGVTLQGSVYKLLQTQKQLAAPLDPFSATLFELFPYYQLGLSAGKDWSRLSLLAGADVRRVEDSSDEGAYNRDFERYYLTGTLPDVLPVVVSLTGELWRATDTDYETWGAALSREIEERWDVELGSYYSLYEYDLFSVEEREHVRSTYVDLRWKISAARRLTLRYEFERNDFDDYHQVRLDYSWGF